MNNIKNKTKEEKKKYNKVVVTKKQRVKTEKGITILALVITVIVLLIIAGVTIASLTGDNGILINAQDAKLATELSKYQEELELYKVDKTMEDANFEEETLTAGKTDLNYNTKSEEEGNIKTIITDITDRKELCYLYIDDRCLCFNGDYNNLINQIVGFKPWYKNS